MARYHPPTLLRQQLQRLFFNMRLPLLLFIVSFVAIGCNVADNSAPADKAIIGTWKLMGMTKEPFPLEKITETDIIGGHMTFKEDRTFEGEVVYPKMPDKNLKVSGTYSVENQTLTVNNQANNSTTKSTLRFEQDFMIASPEAPGASIVYYKRLK
jgi:hypothetical protein